MSTHQRNPLRVLIADDHAIVRNWLRLLLDSEEGIEVIAEAANTSDAVRSTREEQPDLVLIDVSMPGGGAIDATAQLLEASPTTRVIVLSMHDDPVYVNAAFAVGASAYVCKEAVDKELVEAVLRVGAGGTYVSSSLDARMLSAAPTQPGRGRGDLATDEEQALVQLLAFGHTDQEIAERLDISIDTAETRRVEVMRKLALASKAEIVRYALENKLLLTTGALTRS